MASVVSPSRKWAIDASRSVDAASARVLSRCDSRMVSSNALTPMGSLVSSISSHAARFIFWRHASGGCGANAVAKSASAIAGTISRHQ